jgi:hypothetical protein
MALSKRRISGIWQEDNNNNNNNNNNKRIRFSGCNTA